MPQNAILKKALEEVTGEILHSMDRNKGGLLAAYFHSNSLFGDVEDENPDQIHTPEDINDGYCMIWARKAMNALGGPTMECRFVWIDDGEDKINEYEFAHAALFHRGRYYDAECLDGVEHPIDLPFFKDLNGRKELLNLTFMPHSVEKEAKRRGNRRNYQSR